MPDLYERRELPEDEDWEDNPEWIFVEAKPPYFLVKVERVNGADND